MKRDIAERFAATAVHGLSLDDARRVVGEFLISLARCSTCGGAGEFTFGRDVEIRVDDPNRSGGERRVIPTGTQAPCPACRGTEKAEAAGDPDYVAWHCAVGERDGDCRDDRGRHQDRSKPHLECGWRVMLPLPGEDRS